ncbi:MAG TPA: GDP-L-fucose synthase [Candidatus Saccharibacteria bacterium]|nr:GDP-L-fucose synthase [Candidatus Saccharibacteria bacterium]HMR38157.1 GDP-L-fucose synthase [Candidatus Saccharibacteria bacterium]
MDKSAKIYVAGHQGLVGSAVMKRLISDGYINIVTRTRKELDLTNQAATQEFFAEDRPEYVIDSAAKVGSVKANMAHPAEFMYENLQIQNNLIWSAKESGVKKFLFIGSSVIYPRDAEQPINEESFGKGAPDQTNEAYAYAKIAGMKLCSYINDEHGLDFISCMPTNLYGENDNFDPETAHVIPSLIRRMHEAKISNTSEVVIWGTGNAQREFLYIDDLASAIVWLLENYSDKQFVNVGTGEDISIKELALKIKELVGYEGKLVFDATKPDGMPRRLLDVSLLHTAGWRHTTSLDEGLRHTYNWYLSSTASST